MPTLERLNQDFTAAMKARDDARLSTLRMLRSALKNKQIELMRELTEEDVQAVLRSQLKQVKDSLESFLSGGREDLSEGARREAAVLEAYLPAQLSDEDLKTKVAQALSDAGLVSKADVGKAMGVAMKAVVGQADASRVKQIVSSILVACVFFAIRAGDVSARDPLATQIRQSLRTAIGQDVLRYGRVVAVLFLLLAIYGLLHAAFKYMTACGTDSVLSGARVEMIKNALIGFFMILLFVFATTLLIRLG